MASRKLVKALNRKERLARKFNSVEFCAVSAKTLEYEGLFLYSWIGDEFYNGKDGHDKLVFPIQEYRHYVGYKWFNFRSLPSDIIVETDMQGPTLRFAKNKTTTKWKTNFRLSSAVGDDSDCNCDSAELHYKENGRARIRTVWPDDEQFNETMIEISADVESI